MCFDSILFFELLIINLILKLFCNVCFSFVGAPDSGGRQFLVYFMENNVEAPRYLPLELYVTPVRSQSVSVRVESPRWFEPYIREDATVSDFIYTLFKRRQLPLETPDHKKTT